MVSGSCRVWSVGACLDGSSRGRSADRLAVGWKALWEPLTLLFSAPTRSIKLAPSLALHSPTVQPVVSDTCLDFNICPSFSVPEVSPGCRAVGVRRGLVPWIVQWTLLEEIPVRGDGTHGNAHVVCLETAL